MVKIAVVGIDQAASQLAYQLSLAGNDVVLLDRSDAKVKEITENGLTVNENGEDKTIELPVFLPKAFKEREDIIILMTQDMHLDHLLVDIRPLVNHLTKVVCLTKETKNVDVVSQYIPKQAIYVGDLDAKNHAIKLTPADANGQAGLNDLDQLFDNAGIKSTN